MTKMGGKRQLKQTKYNNKISW